jgi:hypothetical protein
MANTQILHIFQGDKSVAPEFGGNPRGRHWGLIS